MGLLLELLEKSEPLSAEIASHKDGRAGRGQCKMNPMFSCLPLANEGTSV